MDLVQDAIANVIVGVDLRGLAHRAGLSCDWWEQPFESNALNLQFASTIGLLAFASVAE